MSKGTVWPTFKFQTRSCKDYFEFLFYWTIASADFEIDDDEVHNVLLKMIVELYVTMRGFSYASMWMEKYKKSSKKPTQRSNSLRRDLYDNNNCDWI